MVPTPFGLSGHYLSIYTALLWQYYPPQRLPPGWKPVSATTVELRAPTSSCGEVKWTVELRAPPYAHASHTAAAATAFAERLGRRAARGRCQCLNVPPHLFNGPGPPTAWRPAATGWAMGRDAGAAQTRRRDEAWLARDRLRELRQVRSVRAYARRFLELMLAIPEMHEGCRLWSFCDGLKPAIRLQVALQQPRDVLEAIWIAETVDHILYIHGRHLKAVRACGSSTAMDPGPPFYEEPGTTAAGTSRQKACAGEGSRRCGRRPA